MLTIERSAFINNSATNGGAVFSSDFVASITNSTFSGNSGSVSGGGVEVQGGNMAIINSTIAGNTGGGIRRVGGGLKLRNSLIANNTGEDCSGGLSENVSNYIEDGTCSPALSSADGSINLGPLTGSPAYYPLLSGSPAIDAAAAAHCPSLDQAGTSRPAGSGCDIGAYEKPPDPPTATRYRYGNGYRDANRDRHSDLDTNSNGDARSACAATTADSGDRRRNPRPKGDAY